MSYIQSKLIKKKAMSCFKLNPTSFFLVQSSDLLPFSPSPDTFPFFGFIPLVPGIETLIAKLGLSRSLSLPFLNLDPGFSHGQERAGGGLEREETALAENLESE